MKRSLWCKQLSPVPDAIAEPWVFGRQLQPAGDSGGSERFGTSQTARRALEPADQGKRRYGCAEKAHAHPAEAWHPLQPLENGVCFYPVASKHNERHSEGGMKSTVVIFFQPKAVRMTILSRLTTLTHLDDILITEEEASKAAQVAAGSKINQVRSL